MLFHLKKIQLVPFLSTNIFQRIAGQRMSDTTFPDTIEGFGYAFNAEGKLRKINETTGLPGNEPYQFDVSKNQNYNQQRYEAIGELITHHVYQLLTDLGLHKIYVPSNGLPTNEASFVFCSKPNLNNIKKLLIVIHGSGVVRAGQWSRSLIMNQSLNHGTQIPYIKRAIELGYDVLITNTNNNYRVDSLNKRVPLIGNESPRSHANTVWEELIASANRIDSIAIVAHSYGGIVTLDLARKYPEIFLNKCFAVGFTDSVHSSGVLTPDLLQQFQKIAVNWVTSSKPLDTPLESSTKDIPRRSAGHIKHEWTSWACIDSVFEFFEINYNEFLRKQIKIDEL